MSQPAVVLLVQQKFVLAIIATFVQMSTENVTLLHSIMNVQYLHNFYKRAIRQNWLDFIASKIWSSTVQYKNDTFINTFGHAKWPLRLKTIYSTPWC